MGPEDKLIGGFTLWFTGLPSSGKSTVAKQVENGLRRQDIRLENLDADDLRSKLHPDLGFTKEERGVNNRRIAYISQLLNKNGVATIVAAVSPFREYRTLARNIIEEEGRCFLIYCECPVKTCKERDPKGLYEKAEEGKIPNFTGVSHPFEEPSDEEYDLKIDTANETPEHCAQKVLDLLRKQGILEEIDRYTGLTSSEEKEIRARLRELGYLE